MLQLCIILVKPHSALLAVLNLHCREDAEVLQCAEEVYQYVAWIGENYLLGEVEQTWIVFSAVWKAEERSDRYL